MDLLKSLTSGTGKRSRTAQEKEEDKSKSASSKWTVVRLAAKDSQQRQKQGGEKSRQRKTSCESLRFLEDGVQGTAKGLFGFRHTLQDYNNYRSQGHTGRFKAGTRDRAVSIATVAAYDLLGQSVKVEGGDLGENILLDGPPAVSSSNTSGGLFVGAKLRVGTALLEVTEANNPCYRFNTQTWAADAKKLWGKTAPEGNEKKWFHSPKCPLNHRVNPGVRGWLAKVLEEGEAKKGDAVELVEVKKNAKKKSVDQTEKDNEDDARPSKRRRLSRAAKK